MKTQITSFAIAAMIMSSATFSGPAISTGKSDNVKIDRTQSTDFAFFRAHRQGKGITTTWGLTSNVGVTGFSVKKTYEDPSDPYSEWEEVATAPCSGSRAYKCTDNGVSPGFINYKVEALMDDGTTVESSIITVHVVSH